MWIVLFFKGTIYIFGHYPSEHRENLVFVVALVSPGFIELFSIQILNIKTLIGKNTTTMYATTILNIQCSFKLKEFCQNIYSKEARFNTTSSWLENFERKFSHFACPREDYRLIPSFPDESSDMVFVLLKHNLHILSSWPLFAVQG